MSEPKKPECPKCKTPMNVLLFLDTLPDGYVCPKCNLLYGIQPDGQPAAQPLARIF